MDQPLVLVILFVAVAAIVVVGAVMAHAAEKSRREALAALAAELGFSFSPERDTLHDEQYAHFEVFRRGHSRAAYNTMEGRVRIDGRMYPARMGDFVYKVTSGSGKNRRTSTHRLSYLIAHLPFPGVPALLIRPENVLDKIAGAIGFDDIDFESAEFSRRFHVSGPDKRFAYDVVHPRMMEFLLASDSPTIDIENGRCCLMDGRRRWEPAEFRARIDWLRGFFDLWPDHLTRELDARADA